MKLGKYLATLPPAPSSVDWLSGIADWGVLGNDVLGDCTVAGVAHAVQVWAAATGPTMPIDPQMVVDYYSKWAGYVPGNPLTDNGAVEIDILNRWRQEGFGPHRLLAYADPDPGNREHVKQSIQLFGGVYIGLSLPISAQSQSVWDYTGRGEESVPGTWGGHCVFVCAYDLNHLACITWGFVQLMTWEFWDQYCDEAHCLLSPLWLDRAPSDFALGDLQADLAAVAN